MKKISTLFMALLFAHFYGFSFSGGNGTAGNPYLVSNVSDLDEVRSNLQAHYKQTADIDLGGEILNPIGFGGIASSYCFTGVYDGGGYAIIGLNVKTTNRYAGLFGQIGYAQTIRGIVKNLRIELANVESDYEINSNGAGILVGLFAYGEISNCMVSGTVKGYTAGGIAGIIMNGSATNCSSSADVFYNNSFSAGATPTIGGFVGVLSGYHQINNCYSSGNVNNSHASGRSGGFAGSILSVDASSVNCFSTVNVNAIAPGGFVGYYKLGNFTNCFFDHQTAGTMNVYGSIETTAPTGVFAKTTEEMKTAGNYIAGGWDFTKAGNLWAMNESYNNGYPWLRVQPNIPLNIWLGTSSAEWSNISNWSEGIVPSNNDDIIIANVANDPIISPVTMASCRNIKLEPQSSLTIASNSTNTGSLIIEGAVSGIGTATVQRYLTSGGWRLIASPVTGQTVGNFLTSTGTILLANPNDNANKAMKDYDEGNNTWNGLAYYTNTGSQMGANKGYAVWPSNNGAVSFTGMLQSGSINVDAVRNANGWNCMGNPYTSAIAINSNTGQTYFINENSSNIEPSYAAIYLWEHTNNSYTIINNESAAYYAAVGQAFFVKAKNAGASTVSFTPVMQSHQTGATFKSAAVANPTVAIEATQNTKKSLATVKFISNCTPGLDFGYDAGAMKTGFDVFTRLVEDNGVDFALQCLPSIGSEGYSIPVGIETTEAGIITLKFTPQNLPAGYKLMLEDRLNNTNNVVSSNNPIVADVTAGTTLGRFYLSVVNATNSKATLNGKVFVNQVNGRIYISGIAGQEASASLYDVQGRLITTMTLNRGLSNEIEINEIVSGVYLLKVEDQGMVQAKRIQINNK